MTSLAELRKNYSLGSLDVGDVDRNPFRQFDTWFKQAVDAQLPEPNTMTLATVDPRGRPSARIVLIKGVDERGFVFFTNYESRKGRELAANPYASLLFYWIELERQVRVEGRIVKTSAEESDGYFASRPLGSRIGAWASNQSQVIESRSQLETREREFSLLYGDQPPRPPHWGGYRLVPEAIEFWQGRPSRLHDRLLYTRSDEHSDWQISRLSP
ncbi:pyridoxamine 5'-phosphate oxidase [Paraburkholderia xenovorans LB400]|jgi:pyridoxamine 5'-phosphate oxidase|uniref:Pyridoxine/pyridoxamine 5'-phosphate oxidase n=1 Tax=Paraburkholderia xenovorans (strain LB400) TaxID=266265 RepID=PDXH_PARXL|nr:pyridoxamine 5'-phosphate oxidase [Paraburkholderia xenovorans]Q13UP6.1 RecName: Full=Pyridoxine/pyridoxamine 5'-phosphate oxidase; AltName: Full=PNP/PMP oxidase; Short=PNPOx; AltName: Full=Pyridoxal 5'-phosphate synthase [Paraburkholderia xenovorans LB400]ABE32193.1 Pyridoxamine 5'-phosphate oxidase [Paraburkholderia xenovorans LB400]AIP31142.1 pyridoxamine 5'-phosphate oxidase [Paraburkholderia xenovorans LB400]NPT33560.1 pyridoxamine 5'-phosphate oxidase [Paraburkholderia xenovorans]